MAWKISGTYAAPCSCGVGCPCLLGEMEGDQEGGWCSGILAIEVSSGESDGVDLSGTKAVALADWPKGFLAGDGTGRVYVDEAASDEQAQALADIILGKKGGSLEPMATLIPKTLDTKRAAISFDMGGDTKRISLGDIGEAVFEPLKGPTGEPTRVMHGAAAFRDEVMLGKGTETHFHDPDMRDWQSLGHAEFAEVEWSG
jgi:hypothetical protein